MQERLKLLPKDSRTPQGWSNVRWDEFHLVRDLSFVTKEDEIMGRGGTHPYR